jgi:hypothetical protein
MENIDQNNGLSLVVDLNVLRHLGMKMYASLPAVISEYVANSWDAWAENVKITIPKDKPMNKNYEIQISDDGDGMSKNELDKKFLVIGRNRRNEDGEVIEKEGRKRKLMGRKGIGKLAGFGIAGKVGIKTRKNGRYVEIELDYEELKDFADKNPEKKVEFPIEVKDEGETEKDDGTVVTITRLKRERRPAEKYIRQRIARRFSVLGNNFDVYLNNEEIGPDERNIKKRCQFLVEYDNEVFDLSKKAEEKIEKISGLGIEDICISGWIGTFQKPVPSNIKNGVSVMTRGKLVQKPDTFGLREGGVRGQHALQYLVGEIHADFLDHGDLDLITTNRNSVVWQEAPAEDLRLFLRNEIKGLISSWPEKRGRQHVREIKEKKPYKKYIAPLDKREKELADEFLGKLGKGEGYDQDMLKEIASYVSSGVQQRSFLKLLEEIENSEIENTDKLLELFNKYEVLDAMNTLRIVKGRYQAINKFESLIQMGRSFTTDLTNFISDNPWIIDPQWGYLDKEIEILNKLKSNFNELEKSSDRAGLISLGDNESIRVVKIFAPKEELSIDDLNEFKNYVDYLRRLRGSHPIDDRQIEGYIIGKKISEDPKVRQELVRIKKDQMYFRSYEDLQENSRKSHQAFMKVLERKAKRTNSEMLKNDLDNMEEIDLNNKNRHKE